METYNGASSAVWPSGIAIPDDADLAKGISSVNPAFEALADRTAILKDKLGSLQVLFAGSVTRGVWDRLTPLVASQYGQGWTTPSGDSALYGWPALVVNRGDLVLFSASFVYIIENAHDSIRVAYQKLNTTDWVGIDSPRVITLSNDREGNATLTTTFVPYDLSGSEDGAINLGLQLNGGIAVYGPISWTIMVLRGTGL